MKTKDIITESAGGTGINLDFNDLTSLQIGTLRALSDGRVDFENATDRMLDLIDELQGLNLVDMAYGLTPTGEKALGLANTIGGAERRAAALKAQKKDEYDPAEDEYNDYDDQFSNDDWSNERPNNFGGGQVYA